MKGDPGLGQASIPRLARRTTSNKVKRTKLRKQLIAPSVFRYSFRWPCRGLFEITGRKIDFIIGKADYVGPFVLSANIDNLFEHNDMLN